MLRFRPSPSYQLAEVPRANHSPALSQGSPTGYFHLLPSLEVNETTDFQ